MDNINQIKRDSIGKLLLEAGKIKVEDTDAILREQSKTGEKFGDIALKLGMVTKKDIDDILSIQFDFPYLPKDTKDVDPMVVSAYEAFSINVEQIRLLRGQLLIRWFETNKSMLVLGARSKQGVSTIIANLAVSLAQLGKKTLIVDANMRSPYQNNLFKLISKEGFSDILASRAGLECISTFDGISNLNILTAGTTPPNPLELLNRQRLKDFVTQIEGTYDCILYDTPAVNEYSDSLALMSVIGGSLLIARRHKANISDMEKVMKEINLARCKIIGAVLNDY